MKDMETVMGHRDSKDNNDSDLEDGLSSDLDFGNCLGFAYVITLDFGNCLVFRLSSDLEDGNCCIYDFVS